jgi:hypothetical protein
MEERTPMKRTKKTTMESGIPGASCGKRAKDKDGIQKTTTDVLI